MEPSNRPPIIHLADCVSRRPYFPCPAKICLTTSLLKLLSNHLITLRNISFQLVHFDCNSHIISLSDLVIVPHVTPLHVALEGTSSIAAASSCLSHRISVEVVSIVTSMNRRGTYISVTRRRQRRNSQSQRRTSVL